MLGIKDFRILLSGAIGNQLWMNIRTSWNGLLVSFLPTLAEAWDQSIYREKRFALFHGFGGFSHLDSLFEKDHHGE